MSERLVIVGASVRAAAVSARRAGFAPLAADLFADRDLADCCPTIRVTDYPAGFPKAIREFPAAAWLYCGGLENYPAIVDEISAERPLLGNPGSVLRRIRDPLEFARVLRDDGLDAPAVALSLPPHRPGPWLRKPRGSSAGFGIRRISHDANADIFRDGTDAYFQEQIDGLSCSAVFVAKSGSAELIGVTEQLVGCDWLGTSGFRYCGSIGPLPASESVRAAFRRIGACLAERFDLAGLFGVDAIVADERVWPVEVNPRYTASVEILERSLGVQSLRIHVAACRGESLPPRPWLTKAAPLVYGKAILFANRALSVPREFADFVRQTNRDAAWPVVADIPHDGSAVEKGQPITTVFAEGGSIDSVRDQLRDRAAVVRDIFEPSPPRDTV